MLARFKQFVKVRHELIILLFLLLLVLAYRAQVLLNFGLVYIDGDQTVMWAGLLDFAAGEFNEPRFYGQPYSSMLEAFLAVPLYYVGIPPNIAVGIATVILTLIPFLLVSFTAYKQRKYFTAGFSLLVILLLPIRHAYITSLPRGFVTGIAVAGLASIVYLHGLNTWRSALFAFLLVLAFSLNPNSILLIVPLMLMFIHNYSSQHNKLLFFLLGAICGLVIHFLANQFYHQHPNYIVHGDFKLDFEFSNISKAVMVVDDFLNDLTPIFWTSGFLLLIIFLIMSYLFYREGRKVMAIITATIPFIFIFTLGFGKVYDSSYSVFFPRSRMYLALPVLLIVLLCNLERPLKFKGILWMVPIGMGYFIHHFMVLQKPIEYKHLRNSVFAITTYHNLRDSCLVLQRIAAENEVDLIIFSSHYLQDLYNYGCAPCVGDFPKTLRPAFERRTWRMIADENKVYKNVLVIDDFRDLDKSTDFIKKLENMHSVYLVENNTLGTMKLIEKLNIGYREFRIEKIINGPPKKKF